MWLCFYQDLQTEVPSHLLRLKVDVERSRVALILQDCRAELEREIQALSGTCTSERVIKEHRVSPGVCGNLEHRLNWQKELQKPKYSFLLFHLQAFFKERKPLTLCEKRIRNMEDLCHNLPDNDPVYRMLDSTKKAVEEVTEQIKITHLKLEQHPDKWKEWNDRYAKSVRHSWVPYRLYIRGAGDGLYFCILGSVNFLTGCHPKEGRWDF